jgi:signal transduction histidine kinase
MGSFLYIILILVAWQFEFRHVIIFTLSAAFIEILLNIFFPLPEIIIAPFPIQSRLVYFSIFLRSVAFLVLGYVVVRLVKAQRQQRRTLAEANQKLVRHAATLEQLTTTRERVRLSRELHDTLAHTLSALAVQIDAIFAAWEPIPDKARRMLETMLDTTRSGLDETRRAMRALRASPLEEMGLAHALCLLVEDFAARHALALDTAFPDNLDDLPPEVEQCYYRVAQESLENIARHARAKRLQVSMAQQNGRLELYIADDGVGVDPAKMPNGGGLGIKGMRERAELIGAQLSVEGQPGQGVAVRLILDKNR